MELTRPLGICERVRDRDFNGTKVERFTEAEVSQDNLGYQEMILTQPVLLSRSSSLIKHSGRLHKTGHICIQDTQYLINNK